jgi:hypothetical protein
MCFKRDEVVIRTYVRIEICREKILSRNDIDIRFGVRACRVTKSGPTGTAPTSHGPKERMWPHRLGYTIQVFENYFGTVPIDT